MAQIERVGDLEITQDLQHQKRERRVEHVGWAAIALVLFLSAIGVLGQGGLSNATFGDKASTLWAEYYRIFRYQTAGELRVHVGGEASQNGQVQVRLNRSFLEEIHITEISPEPETTVAGDDQFTYTFNVDDAMQQTVFVFRHEPTKVGIIPVEIQLQDGRSISFSTFILP